MTLTISELTEADIPELRQLLLEGFGVDEEYVPFLPEVLQWKYLSANDGFTEPKSFIARQDHQIVAHIGLCYRHFTLSGTDSQVYRAIHPIDWYSSPKHPGVGTALMLKAFGQAPIQYIIGGTADAKKMYKLLSFQVAPPLAVYRKILRPAYPLLREKGGLARRLARSLRNAIVAWRHRGVRSRLAIDLQQIKSFDMAVDRFSRRTHWVVSGRDAKLLNHFLAYPGGGFSGYLIQHQQACIGLAVLKKTLVGTVMHGSIAECLLDTDEPDCWISAYRALGERLRSEGVDVVTIYSSTESCNRYMASAGFHPYLQSEVFVRDRGEILREMSQLYLSRLEADHSLL